MAHVGPITGQGTVISTSGQRYSVHFELHVHRDDPPGSRKTVTGQISPFCFPGESGLTLEMLEHPYPALFAPGCKLEFIFTNPPAETIKMLNYTLPPQQSRS